MLFTSEYNDNNPSFQGREMQSTDHDDFCSIQYGQFQVLKG